MGVKKGIFSVFMFLFSLIFLITDVKSASMTISPSTNIQAGAQSLTVRCTPSGAAGLKSVFAITIRRKTNSGTDQPLASISTTDNNQQPIPGSGITTPKYTVTGDLSSSSITSKYVQIVIQNPDCADEAEYFCKVTGFNNVNEVITPEQSRNVTVGVNPTDLLMTVQPNNINFKFNDSVRFFCNGDIGNPPKTWLWQTRRFPDTNNWLTYQNNDDIVSGNLIPPTGTRCSYRQSSTLTYRVQSQDNGLQIRCILDRTEEFSRNFTIYLGTENGPNVTPGPTTGDNGDLSGGAIAGIVIGVLAIIIIVIVIIVLVLRRKKTPGKDYDTGESGKGPDPRAPHQTDPKYDSRNNDYDGRGHVNKTLDEPHETRRPYNIHSNGGRHNPGLDDSTSDHSRVEYPAEDGTDIRGSNAMLGSAV